MALARLNQAATAVPNPSIVINTIPLLEAQASSEIENIVTTTDALFRHVEDEGTADPATKETLRYRSALRAGFDLTKERGVTAATATEVCSIIKDRQMTLRSLPGTRIGNPLTKDITYSPPEGADLIAEKLSEWERFVHGEDELDPVVRMAAAHYQFEAIHPFADGNGRTGRILNVLMLVERGILDLPVLYLSGFIIASKDDYYRHLLEVTAQGDWESWLLYMLAGIQSAADDTTRRISEIRRLQDGFAARTRLHFKGGINTELLSILFEQPYCRVNVVMDRCEVSRPTATTWLQRLEDAGLLESRKEGRNRLYLNAELIQLLTRRL